MIPNELIVSITIALGVPVFVMFLLRALSLYDKPSSSVAIRDNYDLREINNGVKPNIGDATARSLSKARKAAQELDEANEEIVKEIDRLKGAAGVY